MEHKDVTPDNLNSVMEFDHVIRVHADSICQSETPAGWAVAFNPAEEV